MRDFRPLTDDELETTRVGQHDYTYFSRCLCGGAFAWYGRLSLGYPGDRESGPCPTCGRVYRLDIRVKEGADR